MQVAKKTCSTLGRRIGVVNKTEQVKRDELENHKIGYSLCQTCEAV